jgi:phospholipase/carboxylesterase
MKTYGPLFEDHAFALAFRTLRPPPDHPTSLLVLLHGVGGDETNLASLAASAAPGTLVVMPRGPVVLGPGAFGWFRVAFTASGPAINAEEAESSRRLLVEFIGQLQLRHGIEGSHTVVAGFSQGGILSASVALSEPERVAGFGILAGRILPELEPRVASPSRLASLRGSVAHGDHDEKLPVDWAHRASAGLSRWGVSHVLNRYPAGHALTAVMQADFMAWLDDPAAPGNARAD